MYVPKTLKGELSAREFEMFRLRFNAGWIMDDIAAYYGGISRERVRQLCVRAERFGLTPTMAQCSKCERPVKYRLLEKGVCHWCIHKRYMWKLANRKLISDVAQCRVCKEYFKWPDEFRTIAGHICIPCDREKVNKWHRENSEYCSAKAAEWRKANPKRAQMHVKNWQLRNPEKTKQMNHDQYIRRRDKARELKNEHRHTMYRRASILGYWVASLLPGACSTARDTCYRGNNTE